MDFKIISKSLLCFLIVLSVCSCGTRGNKKDTAQTTLNKPNILFIAVDDLRPELGSYGNTIIHSPNMDNLASEGFVFTNHYVQVPTCGASRYSLLTGLRPTQKSHLSNNVFEREMANKSKFENPESFVHQLKRNGYYTVGIGKISHSADGLVYGYEEQPSIIKEMPYSWDEFLFDSGKWETGWNAFFAYANGENRQSLKKKVKPYEAGEVDDNGYPDGLTADLAVSKLKELKNKKQPFFLGVGFFKPHLPFNAPKKYWDIYNRSNMPLVPNPFVPKNVNKTSLHQSGEFNGYQLTDEKAGLSKPLSDEYSRKLIHAYYASISYIDAQIGKVLDEVKALDLKENTIVVIWGDHGWHLGNGLVWGKHTLFDVALKSALIIKVPGKEVIGKKIKSVVESVDIYPTLMDLCGISIDYPLDGESLANNLKNPDSIQNNVAYSYFKNGISMRTDQYRLTKYWRKAEPTIEFYNHDTDPWETKNIADENLDIVEELMPMLEKGNTGLYK
ncbi:sulfatase [Aureibaculum sp. 2210JD6-5]|uniref:sulfatase n=1 Tax=Aureibaculum sp. 2210JD6-5 TaxID=3103957 RepID=UPI002AAED9DE|nr:sulfatase [Aureibaculum sp. 2210JD6-5]MDY7395481.1 sulfatase [Aureibaculum sp. 2210JD6-5]